MVITNALKSKYVAKGMKQKDVAELLGISQVSFRQKLYNRKDFKGSEIQKLIETFDISNDEIKQIFFSEVLPLKDN